MREIQVLVPTRGRPGNARALIAACDATSTAEAGLTLIVDDDDPMLEDYLSIPGERGFGHELSVSVCVAGPWQPMVHKLDARAANAARDGEADVLAFMGDDHRPRTLGFDRAMIDALGDMGGGIVYGDDLLQRERLATAWAMSMPIVAALGRMVPAPVEHLFCDNAIMDLGNAVGRLRYLPGVVIEHRHAIAGKAPWDDGYVRVNSAEQYERDDIAYRAWLADGLQVDAAVAKAALG